MNNSNIRKLDALGRVVIPKHMRDELSIREGDNLEYILEGGVITLKKHKEKCVFCNSEKEVRKFGNDNICEKCINIIKMTK